MKVLLKTHDAADEWRTAIFSECQSFRYVLRIEWSHPRNRSLVQFIGLNPSTADERQDDPTVRRCKDFAKRWGFDGMVMTNLFAFRSTDPRGLYQHRSPIGPLNDTYLREVGIDSSQVVACWGNHGQHLVRGGDVARNILEHRKPKVFHLGLTRSGHPKHPLYLAKNTARKPMFP